MPEGRCLFAIQKTQLTAEGPGAGRAEVRAEGPAPSHPTSGF